VCRWPTTFPARRRRFSHLWNIRPKMPKKVEKSRGSGPSQHPGGIADGARSALRTLRKDLRAVKKFGIRVPPCFIVVCNNTRHPSWFTTTSRLPPQRRRNRSPVNAAAVVPQFRRVRQPLGRPNTLLIDSEQLESERRWTTTFARWPSEIERFRREIVERRRPAAGETLPIRNCCGK